MPISIGGKNIKRKIDNILDKLDKLPKEVEKVAEKALETAKNTLEKGASVGVKGGFTQKYGKLLADEIGLVAKGEYGYQIVAPMSGNPEIAYQMYFAEYGAGVDASPERSKGFILSSGYTAKYVHKDGYWTYKDLAGDIQKVNTSIPIGYMASARKEIKKGFKNLSVEIKNTIHTRIKRNG